MGCCWSSSASASAAFREYVNSCVADADTSFGSLCRAADLYADIRSPSLGDRAAWKFYFRLCHGSLDSSLQERLAAEEIELLGP